MKTRQTSRSPVSAAAALQADGRQQFGPEGLREVLAEKLGHKVAP